MCSAGWHVDPVKKLPHDPCPIETIWRENLPEKCPLNDLIYGLMTDCVVPIVIKRRRKIRNDKIQYMIKHTRNDKLVEMVRNIRYSYEKQKNYKHNKFWMKHGGGRGKKSKKIEWYINCEFPLHYLQKTYDQYIVGPEQFTRGTRVFHHYQPNYYEPYIIVSKLKTNYKAIKVEWEEISGASVYKSEKCIYWNKPVLTHDFNNHIYDLQPTANQNYDPCLSNYKYKIKYFTIDPWNCKKMETENYTYETILREKYVSDYNNEHEKRAKFWNTYIHPVFTPQGSISKASWFRQQTNVWSITHPPKAYHRNQHMKMRWNQEWAIIIDTVKHNRKRN
jgi:hypothetical protein